MGNLQNPGLQNSSNSENCSELINSMQSPDLAAIQHSLQAINDTLRANTDTLRANTDTLRAINESLRANTDSLRVIIAQNNQILEHIVNGQRMSQRSFHMTDFADDPKSNTFSRNNRSFVSRDFNYSPITDSNIRLSSALADNKPIRLSLLDSRRVFRTDMPISDPSIQRKGPTACRVKYIISHCKETRLQQNIMPEKQEK